MCGISEALHCISKTNITLLTTLEFKKFLKSFCWQKLDVNKCTVIKIYIEINILVILNLIMT